MTIMNECHGLSLASAPRSRYRCRWWAARASLRLVDVEHRGNDQCGPYRNVVPDAYWASSQRRIRRNSGPETAQLLIRFEDDAGRWWQLDQFMHLEHAPDHNW